jgi:hypothetical protein
MELRDIRYFAVVAEHLNIGRAAEALDLSATALTKSLRRLEKSVGEKLVQRAPKGVSLTAVGAIDRLPKKRLSFARGPTIDRHSEKAGARNDRCSAPQSVNYLIHSAMVGVGGACQSSVSNC